MMRVELLKLLRDRRLWTGPAVGVVIVLMIANLAVVRWSKAVEAQAGIQRAAQGGLARDPEHSTQPVRYDWSIGDNLAKFERYIPDARKNRLVIISGMSQMYTINEYKPGDLTIAEHLDNALAPRGTRVFGLAAPNLSHEEALFLFLNSARRPQTKPNVFIFAVAFEKLREVDLRPRYLDYMKAHPELIAIWRDVANRYRDRYPLATRKMLATLSTMYNEAAPEDTLESRMRAKLAAVVPVIAERRTLNSQVRSAIFDLRNAVFGISNMTKRPIVRDRYDTNREFLDLLADVAHERQVELLVYNVPFNPRANNPYIPQEYAAFKQWLFDDFAKKEHVPVANLENAVPRDDWGLFLGGPDFKHFKGAGHRKTATELLKAFGPYLLPAQNSPAGSSRV